jgi:hypothetical protein
LIIKFDDQKDPGKFQDKLQQIFREENCLLVGANDYGEEIGEKEILDDES